ncbi:MAG TPA: hypothetical protein VFY93_10465 [Planctomycetota bacterium]|nr:hypothetical protein [Planctomycetota bacterium]
MAMEPHWEPDEPRDPHPGLTEPVRAIRDAVPTSRHAKMLFDMVVELLGPRAVVETADGKTQYAVFHRETPRSTSVVPWPLLRLGTKGRLSTVIPLIGPAEPPPRPGSPPKLRNLGPGEIVLHDGPHSVTVTYGDDGRWMETSRSEDPATLARVLSALARGTARPVELLAESAANIDLTRYGPGRVLCPEPVPSVQSAWNCGLFAIRDALFDGRIPPEARWAVADGYEGTAIAWGLTREEAISAWRAELLRARPSPPKPAEPSMPRAPPPSRGFEVRGASVDGAWPREAPAVTIPLDQFPAKPLSWGSFVRIVGGFGGTRHALLRRDPDGFTLVGDRALDLVDLDGLDRALAGVEPFDHPELAVAREAWHEDRPRYDSELLVYRVVDERTLMAVTPSCVESHRTRGFRGRMLDGDRLRLRVVRQRRLA